MTDENRSPKTKLPSRAPPAPPRMRSPEGRPTEETIPVRNRPGEASVVETTDSEVVFGDVPDAPVAVVETHSVPSSPSRRHTSFEMAAANVKRANDTKSGAAILNDAPAPPRVDTGATKVMASVLRRRGSYRRRATSMPEAVLGPVAAAAASLAMGSPDPETEGAYAPATEASEVVAMLRRLHSTASVSGGSVSLDTWDLDVLIGLVEAAAVAAGEAGAIARSFQERFAGSELLSDDPMLRTFFLEQYTPMHSSRAAAPSGSSSALASSGGSERAVTSVARGGGGGASSTARREELQLGAVPMPNSAVLESVARELDVWGCDMIDLAVLDPAHILRAVTMGSLERLGLVERMCLVPRKLHRFLEAVERTYVPGNPYHTAVHVSDVVQTTHWMCLGDGAGLSAWAKPRQLLALVLGASVHDAGHPGVNNAFLVATSHILALRYNDASPLENMHAATCFLLMRQAGCDVLAPLSPDDRTSVRKDIIKFVLATDNEYHFQHLAALTRRLDAADAAHAAAAAASNSNNSNSSPPENNTSSSSSPPPQASSSTSPKDPKSRRGSMLAAAAAAARRGSLGQDLDVRSGNDEEAQRLVLMLALHAADVSNPAKPWPVYTRWADRVLQEFYEQGDKEREAGVPVTPMFDRTKPIPMPKFQLGFINAIVHPLFRALDRVDGVDYSVPLRHINDNIRRWTAHLPPPAAATVPTKTAASEPPTSPPPRTPPLRPPPPPPDQ